MSLNKNATLKKIHDLKNSPFNYVSIPAAFNGINYSIVLLTADCVNNKPLMETLGRWRKENEMWYLSQFEVTTERTTNWFKNCVTGAQDRMLFLITVNNEHIGHIGLFRFDFENETCEIDNILRGENKFPGIIGSAITAMTEWMKETLGLKFCTLKVLSDNDRAIRLYERIGYKQINRIPLIQIQGKDGLEWTEAPAGASGDFKRYYVIMSER